MKFRALSIAIVILLNGCFLFPDDPVDIGPTDPRRTLTLNVEASIQGVTWRNEPTSFRILFYDPLQRTIEARADEGDRLADTRVITLYIAKVDKIGTRTIGNDSTKVSVGFNDRGWWDAVSGNVSITQLDTFRGGDIRIEFDATLVPQTKGMKPDTVRASNVVLEGIDIR
jgi:hypothetical protein